MSVLLYICTVFKTNSVYYDILEDLHSNHSDGQQSAPSAKPEAVSGLSIACGVNLPVGWTHID